MTFNRTTISHTVAAAMLGTALMAGAGLVLSQPYGEGGRGPGPRAAQMSDADRALMRERMQARMNQRLDRLGARLEIKAAQQDAWTAFRKTIETMFQDRPQRPGRDADAASLMRFRAEMANRMARNLTTVADATAQLQQVLDGDQRKVLDEIARNLGPRGHRGGHRGDHGHGPRGGFGPGRS